MKTPSTTDPKLTIGRTFRASQADGRVATRKYSEGPAEIQGDVQLRQRYFTYETDGGLVAGKDFNVVFTIERPPSEVWPYLKDFNLWQNSHGFFYSGVMGDVEGKTLYLTVKQGGESLGSYPYTVLKVIPEYLIVATQPVPEDGSNGGISPGFHAVMLNGHDRKTTVTVLMEHSSRTRDITEEEALASSRKQAPESHRFWRDTFIPTLKKLVYQDR